MARKYTKRAKKEEVVVDSNAKTQWVKLIDSVTHEENSRLVMKAGSAVEVSTQYARALVGAGKAYYLKISPTLETNSAAATTEKLFGPNAVVDPKDDKPKAADKEESVHDKGEKLVDLPK